MLDHCQVGEDKNLGNLYTVKQRLSELTGKLIGLNDADKWESRELKISVSMSRVKASWFYPCFCGYWRSSGCWHLT